MNKILTLCGLLCIMNNALSQENIDNTKLLNKFITFSTYMGAAKTQCSTLVYIIDQSWSNIRTIMINDLSSNKILKEDDAALTIDRAFESARVAPESQNILKNCDMVLDSMYEFETYSKGKTFKIQRP